MAPTLRVTPSPLSSNGLTIARIEAWFEKYRSIAAFYAWSSDETYKYVPLFLEDSVLAAYDGLSNDDKKDLEKVKNHLIQRLLTKDVFEDFNSRVLLPSESLLDYSYDLKHLAARMLSVEGSTVPTSVIDGVAKGQFLRGIPQDIARKLRVLQLPTLEECVQRAQILKNDANVDSGSATDMVFYANYGQRRYQTSGKGKGKGRLNGYGKGGYRKGGGKGSGNRPQQDPFWYNRCYVCGRLGHLARDCPTGLQKDDIGNNSNINVGNERSYMVQDEKACCGVGEKDLVAGNE